ncbi:MAG: hypothetical protein P4L64_11070 [Caulobacteraceae bacterium]|nr:hypothetical protein [Caulobacteraceae bacterium]
MATREDIFTALFALSASASWSTQPSGFAYRSRRVKLWGDLPAQPALCQAEHDETVSEVTRLPSRTTLAASWLIYHDVGKDPDAVPASETNLILDAVQSLFPTNDPDAVQTLGGLVRHCFISGKIFKDPGDLDGQGLIIVPITILVP